MKRVIKEEKQSILSASAINHVKAVTREVMADSHYVEVNELSHILQGELEELGEISLDDGLEALSEIKQIVKTTAYNKAER